MFNIIRRDTMKLRFIKKMPRVALGMALVAVLSCSTVYTSSFVSRADNIDDAKKQKEEAENNKDNAQGVLDSINDKINEVNSAIEELDAQVTDVQTKITEKQKECDALNTEIDETNVKLDEAKANEERQYEAMKVRIQFLYENGEVEYLDTLMSSSSFSDMLNKSEYVEQLSNYDQIQLDDLINTRKNIETYEATLEKDLKEVEVAQTELEVQETTLNDLIDQKQTEMNKYKDDASTQEAIVAKYAKEMEDAEALIAKYEEAARQADANNGGGSGGGYSGGGSGGQYDPSGYAGRLMWPATQGTRISSPFGRRSAPVAGASTFHKGIDIPCPTGSDIVAAESGTVLISTYSSSAGNYVMINHGNGIMTVYMHNSQLCVSVGQQVSKGQVIAKAGSTGYSTGPHCHFGVKLNGEYVNPVNFL